jgi:hypothetical protein
VSEDCHDSGEKPDQIKRVNWSKLPSDQRKVRFIPPTGAADAAAKAREHLVTVEPIHPMALKLFGDAHVHPPGYHCKGCADLFLRYDQIFLRSVGVVPEEF